MKRSFVVNMLGGFVGVILALLIMDFTNNANALSLNRPAVSHASTSSISAPSATPISSTFTYQGQLKNGGTPVNGSCNMAFRLYDDPATGNLIGSPITTTVPINNGLFTAGLNFGNSAVTGIARWLDIRVRCPAGSGSYTMLTPRQPLTPAPVALTFGAPGSVSGYLVAGASGPYFPTIGFNTSGPSDGSSYLAGVAGYGGLFQFQNEDGALKYYTGSNVAAGQEHIFTDRLTIGTDGNVLIGTTTNPFNARLVVGGSDASSGSIAFQVTNSTGDSGLMVWNDGTVSIGTKYGSSAVHTCYNTIFFSACNAAAEYVPTIDEGAGYAQAADLVSIAPSAKNPYGDAHSSFVVTKSTKACDDHLLGVIGNPESGADGEKKNEHYLPLAIYGHFSVKVTLETGAIERGDPLTSSSKPGYAMKATQACKIIGYALEDADHEGTIQVFAHLSENAAPEVASLRAQVQELKAQNAAFEARLTALENAMQTGGKP